MTKQLLFLFICVAYSCKREDVDTEVFLQQTVEDTSIYHDANYVGLIEDEQRNPLDNVNVAVENASTLSNKDGVYIMPNVKTNSMGMISTLAKNGYYREYLFSIIGEGAVGNQSSQMSKLNNGFTFAASESKTIPISNDVVIEISPNSFKTRSGQLYSGQQKVYIRENDRLINVPIQEAHHKLKILDNGKFYQIEVISEGGEFLQLARPLVVRNLSPHQIYNLNLSKNRFEPIVKSQDQNIINNLNALAVGKAVNTTMVNASLKNREGISVNLGKIKINQSQATRTLFLSQSGKLTFYAIQNSLLELNFEYGCSGVENFVLHTTKEPRIDMGEIKLQNEGLKNITSSIASCGGKITDGDMISLLISDVSGNKNVFFQTIMEDKITMPICNKIKSIKYNGSNLVNFTYNLPIESNGNYIIKQNNICLPKVIGYLNIDGKKEYFTSNQISITREGQEKVLSITDYTGLLISANDVTTKGSYMPSILLLNNPKIIDCINNCNNITMNVETLSKEGEKVVISILGKVGGSEIDGKFEQILKK
jgi:hypothetical protein